MVDKKWIAGTKYN